MVIIPAVEFAMIADPVVAATCPSVRAIVVDPFTLLVEMPAKAPSIAPEFAIVIGASVEFAETAMLPADSDRIVPLLEMLIEPVRGDTETLGSPAKIPTLFVLVVRIAAEFVIEVGLFRVTARMPTSPAEITPLFEIVLLPTVGSVNTLVVTMPNNAAFTLPEFVTDIAPLGEMSIKPLYPEVVAEISPLLLTVIAPPVDCATIPPAAANPGDPGSTAIPFCPARIGPALVMETAPVCP